MPNYSMQHRFELARVTVETLTPLSISDGQGDGLFDNLIVRDANDLPATPGSSIAGVMRSIFRNQAGGANGVENLFGSAIGDDGSETASRVHVSWGCIHDQNDKPVQGLLLGDDQKRLKSDPILVDALKTAPVKRDRVRLNHRGCAVNQGLFNRTALTAGHRFTFELSLRHEGEKSEEWQQLLALLVHPAFRLGGGTRAGLGALKVIRIHHASFDLRKADDFQRLGNLKHGLGDVSGLTPLELPKAEARLQCRLELSPCDTFRIGGGFEPLETSEGHEPKLIPITEHRVHWQANVGKLEDRKILLPASAIKGAVRHRLAYHDRVLAQCFADQNPSEVYETEANEAVRNLFGFATDHDEQERGNAGPSNRGHVIMNDLYLEPQGVQHITHNVIDAFTGGVRNHLLFCEEVVSQTASFTVNLNIVDGEQVTPRTRRALQRTLTDLVEGRLALGAGSNRGHGFFTGTMTWSDAGRWMRGEA